MSRSRYFPPDSPAIPTEIARFEREARAAGALNHQYVAVYDIGRDEAPTGSPPSWWPGNRSPGDRTRPAGGWQALEIATQIADGLAAAHAAGIVLAIRSLPTSWWRATPRQILDFGLALRQRTSRSTTIDMTAEGTVMALPGTCRPTGPRRDSGPSFGPVQLRRDPL